MERLGMMDTKLSVDLTSDKPKLWGAMSLGSWRGGQVIYSSVFNPPFASSAGTAGPGDGVPTILPHRPDPNARTACRIAR